MLPAEGLEQAEDGKHGRSRQQGEEKLVLLPQTLALGPSSPAKRFQALARCVHRLPRIRQAPRLPVALRKAAKAWSA